MMRRCYLLLAVVVAAACAAHSPRTEVVCLCGTLTDAQGPHWSKICFDATFMLSTTVPTTAEYHVCRAGERPPEAKP